MIQTPIQKLEFPNDRNVRLYCKREDLLPFPWAEIKCGSDAPFP